MARDPPGLMASSELRDLSLQPSSVRAACLTIIHPQLRDLVLPLERGHVLYPRGTGLEEQQWEQPDMDVDTGMQHITPSRTRTFARLGFVPNCLTASGGILACGGQHGELYMTALPASKAGPEGRFSRPSVKPFTVNVTLPTRSINNSMVILPGWPDEWRQREREKRLGYLGMAAAEEGEDGEGGDGLPDVEEDSDEDEKRDDSDDDEQMDLDDDVPVGSPASSVATYPNTVPFLHAPRIPQLSPPTTSIEIPTITARRSTSFSSHSHIRETPRDRSPRASSSSIERQRPGHPPIQYVTSRPRSQSHASTSPSASTSSFWPTEIPRSDARSGDVLGSKSKPSRHRRRLLDEPRLLISNNDQTVKMFSLRQAEKGSARSDRTYEQIPAGSRLQPETSAMRQTAEFDQQRLTLHQDAARIRRAAEREEMRTRHALAQDQDAREQELFARLLPRASVPPPRPTFGSSFGWDRIAINEGLEANDATIRADSELREFERIIGMRIGSSSSNRQEESRTLPPVPHYTHKIKGVERKLAKVGGTRFKDPVNHSSLSPDLRTMVSVGDSTDVCLFEVIEGGREFRKIGVYSAATDSGFSTAWSKDGRKFAVASQDGQVTVWDHRSSHPMAIFHTSTAHPQQRTPSFAEDLADSHDYGTYLGSGLGISGMRAPLETRPLLVDPLTGDTRTGTSSSGKEAARVVKFSPMGSSRDLMVFSEENSNLHIIDARTFDTHVIVPVPYTEPGEPTMPPHHRQGIDGGTVGIAGVAFDPTGDWLYSGTERTVVEWDLRRLGGGEGGTWGLV